MKKLLLITMISVFSFTCIAQKGKWKNAQNINTVESYQEFLINYPKSEFSDAAYMKLLELEFKKAQEINSIDSYSNFLETYKNNSNPYFEKAQNAIIEIEFDTTKSSNSIDGYNHFIQKYPDSNLTNEAALLIVKLEFSNAENINTIGAYKNFIQKYPDSWQAREASLLIIDMEFSDAKNLNTIEAYKNFIQKYPDSKLTNEASSIIMELEFSNAENLNTIEAYKNFIQKYPDSKLTNEAALNIEKIQEWQQVEQIKSLEARLLFAAKYGNLDDVKDLVSKKVNINYTNSEGTTALMNASVVGNLDVVTYLMFNGADFNIKDKNGNTALMTAIKNGNTQIVSKLVTIGFDNGSIKYFDNSFGQLIVTPCLLEWAKTGLKPLTREEYIKKSSESFMGGVISGSQHQKPAGKLRDVSMEGYIQGGGSVAGWINNDPKYSNVFFLEEGIKFKSGSTCVSLTPSKNNSADSSNKTYMFKICENSFLRTINMKLYIPCYSQILLDKQNSPVDFGGYSYETGKILIVSNGLLLLPGTKILRKSSK